MAKNEENIKSKKVVYGEPVGVITAQSFGERSTQMVLRTFHSAGISSMVIYAGLPRLIEIVDARKKPKHPSMTIKFDKDIAKDYEKVRNIKQKLEEVKVKTLIKTFDEDLENSVLVLHFDRELLSEHSITLRKVIEAISTSFNNIGISNEGSTVTIKYKKKSDIKEVRTSFVHIREQIITGISGIEKAAINEEGKTFYISTNGSNMKDALEIKAIKPENIYTNDIFEIFDNFGIEAARNSIANELVLVLSIEKISMNFRHISLLADTMTYSGSIRSVGRHGIAGDKESVFARAAYEETIKHFVNAGFFSETDKLKGVAENILIGKQVNIGTGRVKLMVKKEDLKKINYPEQ